MTEGEWMDVFANNLDELMRDANMSQKELADATGLSETAISRYLNRRQLPGIKAIINISYELDCDLYDLIDFGSQIE